MRPRGHASARLARMQHTQLSPRWSPRNSLTAEPATLACLLDRLEQRVLAEILESQRADRLPQKETLERELDNLCENACLSTVEGRVNSLLLYFAADRCHSRLQSARQCQMEREVPK